MGFDEKDNVEYGILSYDYLVTIKGDNCIVLWYFTMLLPLGVFWSATGLFKCL